ncbi:PBP1A family penicillin-binding protein [Alishewanella sp. BS5-314]|uniref:penicillin-binding protein 1A n=1 Tax=Alishewanella sp. BS5-314 TaxID=2755587 RepID=UPI0021BAA4A7|nr:PBP1A family penicillin-binding protein [Alishewanella sp. BS5-314]MCT8124629.1 PBP1A family penicillin-binding protein [Alishewanella sp. BS5-314]
MSWFKKLLIFVFVAFLLGVTSITATYFWLKDDLPDVATLKDVRLQTPMQVFTADGELISQFGEQRRIPLRLDEMPPLLIQAFLATEDTRFYEHPGIDIIGIMRAATVVATSGELSQGASTITQQLARNFFLSREKKLIRKIKEIFLAIHIEQLLTKDEILELYLNKIELGHRAFGVGAAAQVYFGKTVQELSVDEMAIIAGLPKAPSVLNPVRSASNARARRNVVLGRMLDTGAIDRATFDAAIAAPVTSRLHGAQITASAPYIAEMVRQQMVDRFGEEVAYTEGFRVYTTINSKDQAIARRALQQNLYDYDERHGYRGPVAELWQSQLQQSDAAEPVFTEKNRPEPAEINAYLDRQQGIEDLIPAIVLDVKQQSAMVLLKGGQLQELSWDGLKWARSFITDERQGTAPKTAAAILKPGQHILVRQQDELWRLSQIPAASSALVAIDPKDGAIRSLVGGYSFAQSQFNRVTQAKRQVGSNIKPFIYSAALEHNYTLASLMNDAPIHHWDAGAGIAWRPRNSPAVYDGPIRIREALAKSKNVVSIRLLRGIGIDATIEQLLKFGFSAADLPRNETLALGSASSTPLEVVTGYAVFANGGFLVQPYVVDKVLNAEDKVIFQHQPLLACEACPETDGETSAQAAPRVISAQNAFLIADALKSSIWGGGDWRQGTGWNGTAWQLQNLRRRDLAGKTGTTNDSKDTWFSGFNSDLAVTSWVGFDDANRSLGRALWNANLGREQSAGAESGARTAMPAWQSFMRQILPAYPEKTVTPPVGISSVRIDLTTGLLSRSTDHTSSFEFFKLGTEPTQYVSGSVPQVQFGDNNQQKQELEELF